jgi:hypothetical protein
MKTQVTSTLILIYSKFIQSTGRIQKPITCVIFRYCLLEHVRYC